MAVALGLKDIVRVVQGKPLSFAVDLRRPDLAAAF